LNTCHDGSLSLGDVQLQSGDLLVNAKIVYGTLGKLNQARDNAIVMPTYYTGQHRSYLPLIGSGKALDPARYFIILPNMFGNGLSSSPSNYGASGATPFPRVTLYDNVSQQARLVFEHLHVAELTLVTGWSMGGMQAYAWATQFPDRVRRLLPYCAAARISPYNLVFLEGLKAALQADCHWRADRSSRKPENGLRAFARVYVGWAYSHAFFRDALYKQLGFGTLEALIEDWETDHLALDASDLLAMLDTWQQADVGACPQFGGDTETALKSIRARTILLPCSTDRYFSPLDNQLESQLIPNCELRTLESSFGHCALSPGKVPADMRFLDRCLGELLAS
jgi:homoserine O-acetyltransferase/O-succinyltransferase